MKMLVVKANFRPDIMIIYEEVIFQLNRRMCEYGFFIPFATRARSSEVHVDIRDVLRALTIKRIIQLWQGRAFFFESRRLRFWRVLDFLAADRCMELEQFDVIFILNQKHSHGTCYAARLRKLPVVTHQHGDYYTPRVHYAIPFRDVEGPGTIRLVWDENSLSMIKSFAQEGDFIISGSLKHTGMQRRIESEKPTGGIMFLDAIFQEVETDIIVAERNVIFLSSLSKCLGRNVEVAMHPLRSASSKAGHHRDIARFYEKNGIKRFEDRKQSATWAICSDSNALFDAVVAGVPCIFLEWNDSILWISSNYPGRINAEASDAVNATAAMISGASRDHLAARQLAFLQSTKIGSPKATDKAFDELLSKISA